MKTLSKKGLSGVIEIGLLLMMLLDLGLMISLPWSVTWTTKSYPGEEGLWYEKYLVVLLISGFVAEFILWQARGIMHNVNQNRPFCRDTVRRLRLLGILCLILASFYFVSILWVARFFMALVCMVFGLLGLILFVFAELFRQATRFKEENDMTI